jgi:transposase
MPGQAHESTRCEPLVQALLKNRPGVLPKWLAGDKGYTARRIREWLKARRIEPVIARQKAERVPGDENDFDRQTYRRRNVVERCIGWLKDCRTLATRFEKLAVNYLGIVHLAMIQRYLRLLDSSDRA